jgi:hypothetical protein
MTIDHRLLEMLVCPICKGPLVAGPHVDGVLSELHCRVDRLAFPIHDGIPVMLEGEARALPADGDATPAPALPGNGAA